MVIDDFELLIDVGDVDVFFVVECGECCFVLCMEG